MDAERAFIELATAGGAGGLPVGPGDDAAVLADGSVVTLDTVVEGVHFDSGTAMESVARKALGACLSDLCAMGAVAQAVFVSAQLPAGCDAPGLARALHRAAADFGVVLAGGDTVAAPPGALALAVTGVGRCAGPAWLRSGARPGDRLVVSGPLGGSRGGRHLRPRPRDDLVALARASELPVHACMDLSDGLGVDLPRLCEASGVGALVRAESVPIHPDVGSGRDPLEAALGDGEDFELLLALPAEAVLPEGLTDIGKLRPQGQILLERGGRLELWPALGHQHAF